MDGLDATLNYVLSRRCTGGGYCFFRQDNPDYFCIEEPNAFDTYYALSTLELLRGFSKDEMTQRFLLSKQDPDGAYPLLNYGYFILGGLGLLKTRPQYRPQKYLKDALDLCVRRGELGFLSLEKIHLIASLFKDFRLKVCDDQKRSLVRQVLSMKNKDGGFGKVVSSLDDTSMAMLALKDLDYLIDQGPVTAFVKRCEDPNYGFVDVPGTSLGCIENIHAGVVTADLIGRRPTFLKQAERAVRMCMNDNGGFSRAVGGGISNLENTYFAVHSLSILALGD